MLITLQQQKLLNLILLFCIINFLNGANGNVHYDKTTEQIWTFSNSFICRCFCVVTDYFVDQHNLAQSFTADGYMLGHEATAIPYNKPADIVYWLPLYGWNSVISFPNKGLREFSTGIITKKSVSVNDKEIEANTATLGYYFAIKKKAEIDKDPEAEAELKTLREKYGIVLSGIPTLEASITPEIYFDYKPYATLKKKIFNWNKICQHQCREIIWKASSPTLGFTMFRPEAETQTWFQTSDVLIHEKIDPLNIIQRLRDEKNLHKCNALYLSFTNQGGELTTWHKLKKERGIRRAASTTLTTPQKRSLPVTISSLAIENMLQEYIVLTSQLAPWPSGLPSIMHWPLGAQYNFKVTIRGQPRTGFYIVESTLYTGDHSQLEEISTVNAFFPFDHTPSQVSPSVMFLGMQLNAQKLQIFRQQLSSIILKIWTPTLLKKHNKQIIHPLVYGTSLKDVQKIVFNYVGQFIAACWEVVEDNRLVPKSHLFFVIQPESAILTCFDSSSIHDNSLLNSSSPAPLFFFDKPPKKGLLQILNEEVDKTFINNVSENTPTIYAALFSVLLSQFKCFKHHTSFLRNTCLLDTKAADMRILSSHPKDGHFSLYQSIQPTTFENISIQPNVLKTTADVLAKCYNRVLPSAMLIRRKGYPAVPYLWECMNVQRLQSYLLVEKGPYHQTSSTISRHNSMI